MPTKPCVLVIRATGLIGLPVTRQRVAAGFDVTALACDVVAGDLRDIDSLVAPL